VGQAGMQQNSAAFVDIAMLVSWWIKRPMYDFKTSFFPDFINIIRAKRVSSGKYFSAGI